MKSESSAASTITPQNHQSSSERVGSLRSCSSARWVEDDNIAPTELLAARTGQGITYMWLSHQATAHYVQLRYIIYTYNM